MRNKRRKQWAFLFSALFSLFFVTGLFPFPRSKPRSQPAEEQAITGYFTRPGIQISDSQVLVSIKKLEYVKVQGPYGEETVPTSNLYIYPLSEKDGKLLGVKKYEGQWLIPLGNGGYILLYCPDPESSRSGGSLLCREYGFLHGKEIIRFPLATESHIFQRIGVNDQYAVIPPYLFVYRENWIYVLKFSVQEGLEQKGVYEKWEFTGFPAAGGNWIYIPADYKGAYQLHKSTGEVQPFPPLFGNVWASEEGVWGVCRREKTSPGNPWYYTICHLDPAGKRIWESMDIEEFSTWQIHGFQKYILGVSDGEARAPLYLLLRKENGMLVGPNPGVNPLISLPLQGAAHSNGNLGVLRGSESPLLIDVFHFNARPTIGSGLLEEKGRYFPRKPSLLSFPASSDGFFIALPSTSSRSYDSSENWEKVLVAKISWKGTVLWKHWLPEG